MIVFRSLCCRKGKAQDARSRTLLTLAHRWPRAKVSLADVQRYPLVLPESGTTIRQSIDMTCALEGILLEPELTYNNSGAMYRYAQRSIAIMFTALLSVRERYADDGFVVKPLTHPQLRQFTIQVQTVAGRELPPLVRAFRDYLIAAIADAKPADVVAPKAARKRSKRARQRPDERV